MKNQTREQLKEIYPWWTCMLASLCVGPMVTFVNDGPLYDCAGLGLIACGVVGFLYLNHIDAQENESQER